MKKIASMLTIVLLALVPVALAGDVTNGDTSGFAVGSGPTDVTTGEQGSLVGEQGSSGVILLDDEDEIVLMVLWVATITKISFLL